MIFNTRKRWVVAFTSPAVIFLLAVTFYPFIYLIVTSLYSWVLFRPGSRAFAGLANYAGLLHDGDFWNSLLITGYFVIGCLSIEHLFGFSLTILVNKLEKLRGLVTTLLMIPMMLPPIVTALIWKLILRADTGVLNYFLSLFGAGPFAWLEKPGLVIASIVIVDVWQWTPFVFLVLQGGLKFSAA